MKTFADKFPKLAGLIQSIFGAGNTTITMADDTITMQADVFAKLEEREATLEQAHQQLADAQAQLSDKEAALTQATELADQLQEKVDVLQADNGSLQESIEAKDARITDLEAQVEALGKKPAADPGTAHQEDDQPDAADKVPAWMSEADADLAAYRSKLNANQTK